MLDMEKHYRILELDKVLSKLAEECSFLDAREAALAIRPAAALYEANDRMRETVDAHMLMARFGTPSFGAIKNVSSSLSRAGAGGTLSMGELLRIAEVLRVIRSLYQWQEHCEGLSTSLDRYFDGLQPNQYLENRITAAIASEEEMRDNASPALADIRRKSRAAALRIREQLDQIIRSPGYQKYLQDPIVTLRGGRFVVPVKAECRNEVPGLVHDTSASGATVFIEPMKVVEANNEIKVLASKEEAEIERILSELSVEVGGFAQSIADSYRLLVDLNVIFAKGRLAYNMKASAPALNDQGITELRKARHPLLDPQKVVSVDISLGKDYDTLVITGPNTGGKTVTLKTLGLLSLMAACGLMLPVADGSKVAIYEAVLADIGDEQSIEQSLSTFSAHITNIVSILDRADERSLVLLDELGAGTDPIEGAALAMAILEQLRLAGAKIAATTHYAELKAYALDTKGVENASCEFDVATLRPTYRLLCGTPGRSNAFAIAGRLGVDHLTISRAKELVSSDKVRFEDVVEKLERARQDQDEMKEEAQRALQEARQARMKAEQKARELEAACQKELDQARQQAKLLVDKARAQANLLLNELEELKKEASKGGAGEMVRRARAAAKSGIEKMEQAADPVREKQDGGYSLPRPLQAGDSVLIVDIDKKGTVLTPGNESVLVQAGIIKTRVPVSNLKLLEDRKSPAPAPKGRLVVKPDASARSASMELDLRGQNAEEAIMELDRFIDQAVLAGVHTLTVIHGKGTGVLRGAVHQHLKRHKMVSRFRLGVYGEGEAGVTIVELK